MNTPLLPVVRRILEDDDEDTIAGIMGDEYMPPEGAVSPWKKIGGDEHAWDYGGTWYNAEDQVLWHFDGLDALQYDESNKDVDPDDVPIPGSITAKLDAQYPLDYEDPDGDYYTQETRAENARERDKIIGNYQYERARQINFTAQRTWNELDVVPLNGLEMAKLASVARHTGEDLDELKAKPPEIQWLRLAEDEGWDNFSNRFTMSKKEAITKGIRFNGWQ